MNGPDGERFPWGEIICIHNINNYDIVEYRERKTSWGVGVITNKQDTQILYHPYVCRADTCRSFYTLDGALIGAIAYQHNKMNGVDFVCRGFGIAEE